MFYSVVKKGCVLVMSVRKPLISLLIAGNIFGCLAVRPPAEVKYTSGAAVESISSNASLSHKTPDRSISGSGYFMYQKPDHMRVVILSPFGSVLKEVYIYGELVTIIDAGNGIAFSGNFIDLPEKGEFSGWRYINWLLDIDPPDSSQRNAVIERVNRFGESEKAAFENGLLISKTTAAGGQVRYGKYTAVQGVAFPLEITYETAGKETFTILLEDPEINVPFAGGFFTPNLSKLRVYPLSSLK